MGKKIILSDLVAWTDGRTDGWAADFTNSFLPRFFQTSIMMKRFRRGSEFSKEKMILVVTLINPRDIVTPFLVEMNFMTVNLEKNGEKISLFVSFPE